MLIWVLVVWAVLIILGAWWLRRHDSEVDGYFERDHQDPPITDITNPMHGGRI